MPYPSAYGAEPLVGVRGETLTLLPHSPADYRGA